MDSWWSAWASNYSCYRNLSGKICNYYRWAVDLWIVLAKLFLLQRSFWAQLYLSIWYRFRQIQTISNRSNLHPFSRGWTNCLTDLHMTQRSTVCVLWRDLSSAKGKGSQQEKFSLPTEGFQLTLVVLMHKFTTKWADLWRMQEVSFKSRALRSRQMVKCSFSVEIRW